MADHPVVEALLSGVVVQRNPCAESVSVLMSAPRTAWQDDVALEMWIDSERDPVRIRLRGVLDKATASNLFTTLNDLIADGYSDFEFETSLHLCDPDLASAITELMCIVDRCGGRSTWEESEDGDRTSTA